MITKPQKQEVDFIIKFFCKKVPTEQEIEEYINVTVHGLGKEFQDKFSLNILRNGKQRMQVSMAMWKEDLTRGLLSVDELKDDFKDYPYGLKIVDSIIRSVTREYRLKILSDGPHTALAFKNFPDVMNVFSKSIK